MRISDWSSDVCSSDLDRGQYPEGHRPAFSRRPQGRTRTAEGAPDGQRKGADRISAQAHPPDLPRPGVWLRQFSRYRLSRTAPPRTRLPEIALWRSDHRRRADRSEEHKTELQSLMRNSYAVFCLKNKKTDK